jgi:alpha-tubulin suppressor-like RCC1 family protein
VGGCILGFGANTSGQLGTGDQEDRWRPTRIAMPDSQGHCLRVVQVSCGKSFSMALLSNHGRLEVRTTGGFAGGLWTAKH